MKEVVAVFNQLMNMFAELHATARKSFSHASKGRPDPPSSTPGRQRLNAIQQAE